jgi:glycosyltransferase involved in cell wall biosynthesis
VSTPKISVVIPSYRGGRYLREAVKSIQDQTFEDWEIVVVLDGCNEETSDLEADPRVRIIRQRNRGLPIARNVGVAAAGADLIAFLDDDDRMLPERLRVAYAAMQDPEVGMCHSQWQIIDAEGNVTGLGSGKESQYDDFLRMKGSCALGTATVRKSELEAVGGFGSLMVPAEDLDVICRLARETKLVFVDEVLSEYRVHGSNLWFGGAGSDGGVIRAILDRHRATAKSKGELENLKALKEGYRYILPSRTQFSLIKVKRARETGHNLAAVVALLQAVWSSPLVTVRVLMRGRRKN